MRELSSLIHGIARHRPSGDEEHVLLQLQLRSEHLMVLANAREREFRSRLTHYIRTNFTNAVLDVNDGELERRVAVGIARAKRHMMSTECAIAGFVSLMFTLGPRYDEHPKIKRALNNFARKDYDRLDVLSRKLSEDDWRAVLQRSGPTAWSEVS